VQARVVEREVAVVRRVRRICGSSISAVGGERSSVAVGRCKVAGWRRSSIERLDNVWQRTRSKQGKNSSNRRDC
jgi:hypothetical protein